MAPEAELQILDLNSNKDIYLIKQNFFNKLLLFNFQDEFNSSANMLQKKLMLCS